MNPTDTLKCTLLSTAINCMAPLLLVITYQVSAQVGNYSSLAASDRSIVINGASGEKLRITPYGDYMVRIQTVRNNEDFYADNRYEMVEKHDWDGKLAVDSNASSLTVSTSAADGLAISIAKNPPPALLFV
jgi:hypothetical protein